MPTTRELEDTIRNCADDLEDMTDELGFLALDLDEEYQHDIGEVRGPADPKVLLRAVIQIEEVVGNIAAVLSDMSRELSREAFNREYPRAPGLRNHKPTEDTLLQFSPATVHSGGVT